MKADALRQAVARITASDSIIRDIFLQPMLPMPGIVPLWSPFCDRQIPVLRYDPAKAKDMLDQAGYRLDPKTKMRIDPNTGKPLRELKILTDTSATRSQIGKKLTDCSKSVVPAKPAPPISPPPGSHIGSSRTRTTGTQAQRNRQGNRMRRLAQRVCCVHQEEDER